MIDQRLAEACEKILSELKYARAESRSSLTRAVLDVATESVLAALEAVEREAGIIPAE